MSGGRQWRAVEIVGGLGATTTNLHCCHLSGPSQGHREPDSIGPHLEIQAMLWPRQPVFSRQRCGSDLAYCHMASLWVRELRCAGQCSRGCLHLVEAPCSGPLSGVASPGLARACPVRLTSGCSCFVTKV